MILTLLNSVSLGTRYSLLATRYSFSCPLHIFQIDAFLRHFVKRRKFTQAFDGLAHAIGYIVNFSLGIKAADPEADGAVRQIVARAQSLQYIRWFQRRRGACRSTGNRHVIDAHPQRLAIQGSAT